jgi:hypothetical protein
VGGRSTGARAATVDFPGAETAFIQGLKATGFFEGKNISIEWRWAEGQYNRLSLLAGELLSRNVAVIVTWDAPASLAAKAATKTRGVRLRPFQIREFSPILIRVHAARATWKKYRFIPEPSPRT